MKPKKTTARKAWVSLKHSFPTHPVNIDAVPAVTVIKLLLLVGVQYSHNTIPILLSFTPNLILTGPERRRKTRETPSFVFHIACMDG